MSDYSISVVVGRGFPYNLEAGHASVTINGPDSTTYLGFGPSSAEYTKFFGLYSSPGDYDTVTVPRGTSPVVASWGQFDGISDYSYVNSSHYSDIRSFSVPITGEQADAALRAANQYQTDNPTYNFFNTDHQAICTGYALAILAAAVPGANVEGLRTSFPSQLADQLDVIAKYGILLSPDGRWIKAEIPYLTRDGISPDINPNQLFNHLSNDPFGSPSYTSGLPGLDIQISDLPATGAWASQAAEQFDPFEAFGTSSLEQSSTFGPDPFNSATAYPGLGSAWDLPGTSLTYGSDFSGGSAPNYNAFDVFGTQGAYDTGSIDQLTTFGTDPSSAWASASDWSRDPVIGASFDETATGVAGVGFVSNSDYLGGGYASDATQSYAPFETTNTVLARRAFAKRGAPSSRRTSKQARGAIRQSSVFQTLRAAA